MIRIVFLFFIFLIGNAKAANFDLEIIQPQPSLTTANRYYKTYTGLEYKVPIGVIGGLYPYTYSLTTYPTGMVIDSSTGIITWSNPVEAGSPHSVTVSVIDSEATTVTRSWTITVDTSNTYFIDAVNGNTVAGGGAGTAASPWKTFDDLLEAGTISADGGQAFFRTGTYTLAGLTETNHGDYGTSHDVNTTKPLVWLAYPGESPIIDFESTGYDDPEPYFGLSMSDIFIAGFTINNPWNFAFQGIGQGTVIAWNTFNNLRNGQDGSNSAFIMSTGTGANAHYYTYLYGNSFNNVFIHVGDAGGAFIKWYGETKSLAEWNTFSNENGSNTQNQEGFSVKAYNNYCVLRKNSLNYITKHAFAGSANANNNMTFEFNLVRNCGTDEPDRGIIFNEFSTEGPAYYYRNTFVCRVNYKNTNSGDGPFNWENNVIVNLQEAQTGLVAFVDATVDWDLIVRTNDLYGLPSAGIVDSSGNLQGAYRTTYLGTRGWEIPTAETTQTISGGVTLSGASLQ